MVTPRSRSRSCISRSADQLDQGRRRKRVGGILKEYDGGQEIGAWRRVPRGGKGNAPPLRFGVPETSSDPYASLRLPNFRLYIIGLFAYTMAIQIQGTVVGWQIYELTHDKLALGLIGLAEALPFIGAALYAGHVADTHDRRRIVLAALGAAPGVLRCRCSCSRCCCRRRRSWWSARFTG